MSVIEHLLDLERTREPASLMLRGQHSVHLDRVTAVTFPDDDADSVNGVTRTGSTFACRIADVVGVVRHPGGV